MIANIFNTSKVDTSKYNRLGVGFEFTDIGLKTYVVMYPDADRRDKYMDEGTFTFTESGLEK